MIRGKPSPFTLSNTRPGDGVGCWETGWGVGRRGGVLGDGVGCWETGWGVGRRGGVLGDGVGCWESGWGVGRRGGEGIVRDYRQTTSRESYRGGEIRNIDKLAPHGSLNTGSEQQTRLDSGSATNSLSEVTGIEQRWGK